MQSFLRGAEKGTPKQLGSAVLNGRPRLFSEQCLRRRRLRGKSRVPAKELLLNLQRDSMQPSLGSVRPLRVLTDFCLKLPYSVFGGAKLSRQLVSHFDGVLVICLGITRRPVEQPQDCLACPVKWIARFRPDVRFWCKRNDCLGCN
jgi:hypothetical protein